MNTSKSLGKLALAGLVPVGKLSSSVRRILPLFALCAATAGFGQTPRFVGGPRIPPVPRVGVQQAGPAQPLPPTAKYRFHTIAVPNAIGAQANGINNAGLVTGSYVDASYVTHGFIWQKDAVQTVDYPGALGTALGAPNNLGAVIGYYQDAAYYIHTVTYTFPSGAWTALPDIPEYSANEGYGIGGDGAATGSASGALGYLAWIWHPASLSYSYFTAPGAREASTIPVGINDRRQVVGYFSDVPSFGGHGFLKDGDTITTIDVPGSPATYALAINNSGTIAGEFFTNLYTYLLGFIRTSDGVLSAVNHPGSNGNTSIGGINDENDICGFWYNSTFVQQAFIAYPDK